MKEQKLDETTLKNLRELMSTKTLFIKTFGQIEIKRRELEKQFNELNQIEEQADESFEVVNNQIYDITKELEKLYPNGSLNLDTGIMTYRD